jgi:hypothetical protein
LLANRINPKLTEAAQEGHASAENAAERLRYGPCQQEDIKAVQATATVLAEKVNTASGSHDAALRMVMGTVERAGSEDGESGAP